MDIKLGIPGKPQAAQNMYMLLTLMAAYLARPENFSGFQDHLVHSMTVQHQPELASWFQDMHPDHLIQLACILDRGRRQHDPQR